MATSHKLYMCPTCSLFYSYIFESFYLLSFRDRYKKLDLQEGISHHQAHQVIKYDIESLSQELTEMRQHDHHHCFFTAPLWSCTWHWCSPHSPCLCGQPGYSRHPRQSPNHPLPWTSLLKLLTGNAITLELPYTSLQHYLCQLKVEFSSCQNFCMLSPEQSKNQNHLPQKHNIQKCVYVYTFFLDSYRFHFCCGGGSCMQSQHSSIVPKQPYPCCYLFQEHIWPLFLQHLSISQSL